MEKAGNFGNPTEDAHHVFPEKFRKRFKKLGINIDNAENGTYIGSHLHRSKAFAYNKAWELYFNSDSVTEENVRKIATELMGSIYGKTWP